MDLAATQLYEDEDFPFTQKISNTLEEEELVQVGTLSINSTDYPIQRGITKIGRLRTCNIVLNDVTVSKMHAEIEASRGQGSTWICDLNSSNKTKLNNLILQPNRSYEFKDGSVIEFGRVRATYRTYCPADDIVIPETPAPSRQKIAGTIIPNTPDSSLNSSGVDDDGSIILGTQKDEEDSVFRRPRVPQQRHSTSFDKRKTSSASSINESDDSQIAAVLKTSDTSENQVSIFDVETQKFEQGQKTAASNSIHDIETQGFFTDASEHLVEAKAKIAKQPPRLNVCDETAGSSTTDIYDVETQNFMDDVNKMGTQKGKVNIRDVTETKLTTDISDVETQNYIGGTDGDGSDTQKSVKRTPEMGKNKSREKDLAHVGRNIHDLETQNYIGDTDGDGSDTQKSVKRTPEMGKNKSREKDSAHVGRNIHDLETQRFDNECAAEDISDLETQLELDGIAGHERGRDVSEMETQLEADGIANETSDEQTNKDKDNDDTADTTKDETNQNENVTKSPNSRCSSPGSLNLSSPGVDEDCPILSNQSGHLLESSDLLAFFGEDIDKQKEARASNTSTPKPLTKLSLKKNSNAENVSNASNNEEDNDEDIFNVPTQRISRNFEALLSDSETDEENVLVTSKVPKKKRGKPRSEEANDDSETDAEEYLAELAEKQRESSGSSNKPRNESASNRNDPGTSVESEDMFNAQTQQLDDPTAKDTPNSSTNPLQKANKINEAVETNEASEVDTASTQNIKNVDQGNRTSMPAPNINDVAPTQLILSRETSPNIAAASKDFSSKDNQNDVAPMQIINVKSVDCCAPENLDCEDMDYELAPTQVIGEDKGRKSSTNEKAHERGSPQANLNDTLEQKLHEMFDDVNNVVNNDHEVPHMSTQYLEDILESSHDGSVNTSIAGDGDIGSLSQKQLEKKKRAPRDQHSANLPDNEANARNVHKAETDSQNSDTYIFTITTRRKRNILRDAQKLVGSTEDVTLSRQDANSPRASEANKEKAIDDNVDMGSNKKRKKISKTENKSDAITETLNDDNMNKTISNENNERRSHRSSKSMKQKDGAASETRKQVLGTKPAKVDDAKGNSSICIPCPSGDGQRAQTFDYTALCESDDDILTRLPAVRISGTLSNPASPSASSTSTVHSARSKPGAARGEKDASLDGKTHQRSLHKRDVENSEKNNKPSVGRPSNSILDVPKTDEVSGPVDTSEDSDSESDTDSDNETETRFRQMANRILNKRQDKGNKKSERSSPNLSKDPKQSTDVGPKSPVRTSPRVTRHSNSQNDDSSRVLQRETRARNAPGSSTEPKKESVIAKRKISLNVIEEDVEQATAKKRKTAQVTEECPVSTRGRRSAVKIILRRQSPNILEYLTKTSSRGSSPIIGNTKSFEDNKATVTGEIQKASLSTRTDANVDSEKSNMKRTRCIINDSQDTTRVNDATAKKNKPANMKETETEASQMQDKVLRVILSPIKSPVDDESQEVESIMATGSSNAQDKKLSIRESSNAKMFQRTLRTRSRKRHNADIETDFSVSTESSGSSETGDSDNMPSDNPAPRDKRARFAKGPIPPLPKAQVQRTLRTRSRKRHNADIETDFSVSIENSGSSETGDSDNMPSDNPAPRDKRARFAKSPIPPLPKAQVQRTLRTRSRKRHNADIETDFSVSTENSGSSETGDSDNMPSDNPAPRDKRARFAKGPIPPPPEAQVQRTLRTRSRKRHNADIETDFSVSTESSGSSETGDSDNMPSDNPKPRDTLGRFVKSPIPPPPEAQVPKKTEVFKKPTRINQKSASSILDSSVESTIGESSTENDASTSSRLSRSRAAAIREREKMEMSQNTRRLVDDNSSPRLNASIETKSPVSTPSRTRRSASVLSNSTPSAMRHKVLFTGITEDYSKIVNTLGGNKVEDPARCTILVTDKVRRTYKFLCALAKGIPIVTIDWLRDSETATRFLDWETYILKDPAAEAKFGFRLRKSLNKAKEKRLLDGCTVVLTPGVEPPPTDELKDMVKSCGGKALLRPPTKWPDRAVVVSREEDLPNARKFLAKAPKTVTVQSTEFILTGILRQETDFEKYKLI